MSADNGIYVLISKARGNRKTKEFRVAEAAAIENLWWKPDYPKGRSDGLNRQMAQNIFGSSPTFVELQFALKYANKLRKRAVYTEYGVVTLDFSRFYFPKRK